MRCIYCLETNRPSVGRAHIFPEALRQNHGTLPLGAVCDDCNRYLGQLDRVVAAHPVLSLTAQALALPGKKGRLRTRVGAVDRTVHEGGITIPCEAPTPISGPGDSVEYRIRPLLAPGFDLLRFRRGLYHLGFNLLAAMDGVERAYDSAFDPVRGYIRRASPGESWPFAQYVVSLTNLSDTLKGGIYDNEEESIAALRLFSMVFYVDLLCSGTLPEFVKATQPINTEVIPAEWVGPTAAPVGGKKYRLTIYVD
jgi:hypothetical protein